MPKAIKKETKEESFSAKDLSVENRTKLYLEELEAFLTAGRDKYGLELGSELTGMPRAIVPRIIIVDLMKQAPQAPQMPKPPVKKETKDEEVKEGK